MKQDMIDGIAECDILGEIADMRDRYIDALIVGDSKLISDIEKKYKEKKEKKENYDRPTKKI